MQVLLDKHNDDHDRDGDVGGGDDDQDDDHHKLMTMIMMLDL